MREIVYLSESKLRQFMPEPRRAPRTAALRVTTPFGGIDMDAPTTDEEQSRHRRQVYRHVELVADWYERPGLRPGQWVQYEVPLRCVTLSGAHEDLVLFVDPAPGGDLNPASGQSCRLLMHGSVRHLRGWNPMSVDGPVLEVANSASSLGHAFVTRAGQVVEALTRHRDPMAADQAASRTAPDLHRRGVQELLHALDNEDLSLDTSALMTGYARVTGVLPGSSANRPCVVASPLIVEYAAAASD
ncbi:SAVMC3_10250 family protein [Streptomyces spinosus]|uniref:SAVMC3_10250 family protein n=1 Tax=Streptomyces spinosus TaxID=2872623 RepID=UPI001CEDB3FC|nr:SAVMC3_10250 family protein [Streptomyces spinosus]